MKVAGEEMPVGLIVVLRYGLATLVLLSATPWNGLPRFERRDWLLVVALGALNFTLAPTLQISGLQYTQSIDVSILIALEPTMTVLLAAMALQERPSGATIWTLLLGTLGMLVLSGVGFAGEVAGASNRLLGNSLFTVSLLCEAAVTVGGGRLAVRYAPSQAVLAMKAAGFIAAVVVFAPIVLSADYVAYSWKAWSSVIYLAVLPSAFCYTVWYRVIKVVPVGHVALSLFVQPIVGTIIGYTLLDETVGVETVAGALLVCASLAWWQARSLRNQAAVQATVPPYPET